MNFKNNSNFPELCFLRCCHHLHLLLNILSLFTVFTSISSHTPLYSWKSSSFILQLSSIEEDSLWCLSISLSVSFPVFCPCMGELQVCLLIPHLFPAFQDDFQECLYYQLDQGPSWAVLMPLTLSLFTSSFMDCCRQYCLPIYLLGSN